MNASTSKFQILDQCILYVQCSEVLKPQLCWIILQTHVHQQFNDKFHNANNLRLWPKLSSLVTFLLFFFWGGPPPKNVDHVELIKMESIQVKSELGNNDKRTFPFPQNYVEHIFMNLTFTTLWQKYYRFTPWICIMDPAHPIPFVITKFMSLAAFYTQRSFRYILLVHRWKQMNVS